MKNDGEILHEIATTEKKYDKQLSVLLTHITQQPM